MKWSEYKVTTVKSYKIVLKLKYKCMFKCERDHLPNERSSCFVHICFLVRLSQSENCEVGKVGLKHPFIFLTNSYCSHILLIFFSFKSRIQNKIFVFFFVLRIGRLCYTVCCMPHMK